VKKEPALKAGSLISMVTSMVRVFEYSHNTGGVEDIQITNFNPLRG
jgi:hypothetical protein